MDIQELLAPKGICLDVPATDKPALLRELARHAEAGTRMPWLDRCRQRPRHSARARLAEVARSTALFVRLQRPSTRGAWTLGIEG